MAFLKRTQDVARIDYKAGARKTYQFPRGNLFKAMNLKINAEVDIVTDAASNAPDYQIANAIKSVSLLKNRDTMWSLSGQMLAAYFTLRNAAEAASNVAIAGTVASNVKGKHFLHCPFAPAFAARPRDFFMDTRKNAWELQIVWNDLTAAGTLFGTVGGLATVDSENWLDIETEQVELTPSPSGQPDALENQTPLFMGLYESEKEVTNNSANFTMNFPEFKTHRELLLYAMHEANTSQKVGKNDILSDKIAIKDTQGKIYYNRRSDFVRDDSSQLWGVGSNLNNGLYHIPFTAYGNSTDAIVTNETIKLRAEMDVTKQANATLIHALHVTQERQ